MNHTKLLLNIFGPSAAGKSTITSLLQEHIEHLYTVDFDVVKRQLVGYDWKRDSVAATEITYDTLTSVTRLGLTVLALLPPPTLQEAYDRMALIARETDYTLLNIEITAPDDVLIQRYQDRLRQIEESGSKWKFKTLDEFKVKLAKRYYRPERTITFDTSVLSSEEIYNDISVLAGGL